MGKAQVIFWWVLILNHCSVDANVRIQNIRYQGNIVTQEVLLNNTLYIQPGDKYNEALAEKSKQAMLDTGLFRSVRFYIEEIESNEYFDEVNSLIDIVFVVTEKIYFLIIPKIKVDDDRLNYGIQLRWDNINGLNHKMRVSLIDRGSTLGVDEKRNLFRYAYPNVNNTAFNFNFEIRAENFVDEEEVSVINREDKIFKFALLRWLKQDGHNRGWFAGGGFSFQNRFNDDLQNSEKSDEISSVELGVDVGYRNVNNFEYNRGGKSYGYRLNWSDEDIGSETNYAKNLLYYRSYYRFHKYPASNLNVQFKLGHANEDILGDKAFRLGSLNGLRGYENNQFSGNTLLLMNFEFMFPHVNYPTIRYVTFIDIGNTYDSLGQIFDDSINVGAGFGLRWKIRALVNVDLRADAGYGFATDSYKFSFGSRHAF